jgi:hypothetical protein
MKERGLICKGWEVLTLLAERKLLVQRAIKPQPPEGDSVRREATGNWYDQHGNAYRSPLGAPGDVLWVREALGMFDGPTPDSYETRYTADGAVCMTIWPWLRAAAIPAMSMPRALARLTLEVGQTWVQRSGNLIWQWAVETTVKEVAS